MSEKFEGIEKYILVFTEYSWGLEYSIGNIVHNIIVTSFSVRWVQGLLGYHIVGCIND